jgi:putative restriction endonuclease
MGEDPADEGDFNPFDDQNAPLALRPQRPGQAQFRFRVLRRYGTRCAVCSVAPGELIVAAHIIEKRDQGSDDPRNGLPLCWNHHTAFDGGMFAIEPETHALFVRDGYTADGLSLAEPSLRHLRQLPHHVSLEWRWGRRRDPDQWSPVAPV